VHDPTQSQKLAQGARISQPLEGLIRLNPWWMCDFTSFLGCWSTQLPIPTPH